MKTNLKTHLLLIAALTCALATQARPLPIHKFRQGSSSSTTEVISTGSKSGEAGAPTSGGGRIGGGGRHSSSTTTVTPTAPTPVQPIVTGTVTFTPSDPSNGSCTGSYHIDPYYTTLSLLTVDVSGSSLNVADGSQLYVTVVISGGTAYPFTSNVISVIAGAGSCSLSEYVAPGTTLVGVTISDISGNILFAGQ